MEMCSVALKVPVLLSVLIGCESQLFLMTLLMLVFACLGF